MHGASMNDYIIIGLLFILATLLSGTIAGAGIGAVVDYFKSTFAYWTFWGSILGLGASVIVAGVYLLIKLT